jgi:hypothetical protein
MDIGHFFEIASDGDGSVGHDGRAGTRAVGGHDGWRVGRMRAGHRGGRFGVSDRLHVSNALVPFVENSHANAVIGHADLLQFLVVLHSSTAHSTTQQTGSVAGRTDGIGNSGQGRGTSGVGTPSRVQCVCEGRGDYQPDEQASVQYGQALAVGLFEAQPLQP